MTGRENLKLKPAVLKSGAKNDGIDVSKMDLETVELSGTWFANVEFITKDLRGSSLRGATFENCNFKYTSFSNTNMAGAHFVNCDFGPIAHFHHCNFRGAVFVGCKMPHFVQFFRVTMQGVWFEVEQCPGETHMGWEFDSSELNGGSFHLGDSRGAIKIRNSWLFGTRFTGGENKLFYESGRNFVDGFQGLSGQQRRSIKKGRLYESRQST